MGEQNMHYTLSWHLIRGHLYWAVFHELGHRRLMVVRGTLEDPYPSEEHLVGALTMEAAYAAYRVL